MIRWDSGGRRAPLALIFTAPTQSMRKNTFTQKIKASHRSTEVSIARYHVAPGGSSSAASEGVSDNGAMTSATPDQQFVEPMPLPEHEASSAESAERDIAEVAAVEVITTVAVHLMSAAAVKCGLSDGPAANDETDLDEARKLIIALAGLVTASAPEIGSQHARSLRDGLRSLQLAFREASPYPDAPGAGPGEDLTGPVR